MTAIERPGLITFKGQPMTLVGQPSPEIGQPAPDASLVANDLSELKISHFQGHTLLLASVPSLDTRVCSEETRKFNEEAANLGQDVRVLTVSMDLPFAQKRWCGAEGIERVQTASDYKDRQFGQAYGLMIKELGLLARSVLVLDKQGTIQYFQLVSEVADEPDYEKALAAARGLSGG
jgi:thiol peroxidase